MFANARSHSDRLALAEIPGPSVSCFSVCEWVCEVCESTCVCVCVCACTCLFVCLFVLRLCASVRNFMLLGWGCCVHLLFSLCFTVWVSWSHFEVDGALMKSCLTSTFSCLQKAHKSTYSCKTSLWVGAWCPFVSIQYVCGYGKREHKYRLRLCPHATVFFLKFINFLHVEKYQLSVAGGIKWRGTIHFQM